MIGGDGVALALTALYLRGLARPMEVARRRWQLVEGIIRVRGLDAQALSQAGLGQEAIVLGAPGVLARAENVLNGGRAFTAACEGYPHQWVYRLGPAAPPAIWCSRLVPPARYVGVVGTRHPGTAALACARAVSEEARRLGYGVVSGGAVGCDRASRPDVEVLPYGLARVEGWKCRRIGALPARLSMAAPDEEFSTALAMERNALIYSLSEATIVADARFKQGGAWIGAVEALRHRRCRVLVRDDPSSPGLRALIALGGIPLKSPSCLRAALEAPESQGFLFAADSPVRCAPHPYPHPSPQGEGRHSEGMFAPVQSRPE